MVSAQKAITSSALWMAALASGGCYASHRSEMLDPPFDAGVDAPMDAPAPIDAPDAQQVDAADASGCTLDGEDRVETLCSVTATGDFPSGEPFVLSVRWSACRCGEGRSCQVRVEGGVIDLSVRSCASPSICDDCTFESQCAIPALEEGPYQLRLDGADVYEVVSSPVRAGRVTRPRCYEVPEPPDPSLACSSVWDAAVAPAEVCFRSVEDVGTNVRFTVTATCRSCFDWTAGCSVERDGSRLVVRPRVRRCDCPTCGACTEPCSPTPIACRSPALRDGTYDVVIEGPSGLLPAGTLTVSDVAAPGPENCVSVGD